MCCSSASLSCSVSLRRAVSLSRKSCSRSLPIRAARQHRRLTRAHGGNRAISVERSRHRARPLPDPALVERLHAGVPVVHLSDQLQVPAVGPLQVGLHLVALPAGLLCHLPEHRRQRAQGSAPRHRALLRHCGGQSSTNITVANSYQELQTEAQSTPRNPNIPDQSVIITGHYQWRHQ